MILMIARLNSLHACHLHNAVHGATPMRMTAHLLAFDTSTELLAIALGTPAGSWGHNGAGGAQASASLLPQVAALCQRAGVALQSLDAIAFGRGPGAFTGLRTSCAVAQGLALGLACPVLPIDSLLIVAEDARAQTGLEGSVDVDMGVAMDARMGEVYAARWRWQAGRWQAQDAPMLSTPEALVAAWRDHPPAWLAGSAWGALGPRLRLPAGPQLLAHEQDRASALLRLAVAAHARGDGVDAAQALPLYLRDKVALTTAERDAVRAAAATAPATSTSTA
jgi:tRNA threonylcarbamoyladenosine biosynthesis protein TsaB